MKNTFKIIGILLLTFFSFYYTNKVVELSKSKDPIMIKILKESKDYTLESVNATISDDYITPGVSGKKVDVEKSYEKMKKLGSYNENLLVFINDSPNISITNIYDKFVIKGNGEDKEVALVFKANSNENIKEILSILKNNLVKGTFFVDGKWAKDNKDVLEEIDNDNHLLANLGYDNNYGYTNIKKVNQLLKTITNKKINYCYVSYDNQEVLDNCSKNQMYTIKPIELNDKAIYMDIKNNLSSGNILSVSTNNTSIYELDLVIKYIMQKGYDIVSLDELLSEDN